VDTGLIELDLLFRWFYLRGEIIEGKGSKVFVEGCVTHDPINISGQLVGEVPQRLTVLLSDQEVNELQNNRDLNDDLYYFQDNQVEQSIEKPNGDLFSGSLRFFDSVHGPFLLKVQ
jgi:hypothetical protein